MMFIGIIPARYASTRFPGKPLVDLCGKPMIQRVYEQASQVLDVVIVATDDQQIFQCVESFGGRVIMTSPDHQCGTDRVYEAYTIYRAENKLELPDSDVVVVNIQGDEPFKERLGARLRKEPRFQDRPHQPGNKGLLPAHACPGLL